MMARKLHPSRYSWLAWCLAAWASLLAAWPATAQAPAMVRIQPATLTLAPGETAGVAIAVGEGAGVFGVEVNMFFDPAVLEIVDANQDQTGVQVQDGLYLDTSQGLVVANEVDNETGVLAYGMTLLAPAEPVSGSGTLLRVTVRAVAPGNSPLTLSAVLASNEGLALPVEVTPGSVTVAEGGSSPATVVPPSSTPPIAVTDTAQGTNQLPATGSPTGSEPGPISGAPNSSAPEAPVQTAAAREATSWGNQLSSNLRPTGPPPVATTVTTDAGGPSGDSGSNESGVHEPADGPVGQDPESADLAPPPPNTPGPGEEAVTEVASDASPIEGDSGLDSEISGPDSDSNLQIIGALALALVLAGGATFYLLRVFLNRGR